MHTFTSRVVALFLAVLTGVVALAPLTANAVLLIPTQGIMDLSGSATSVALPDLSLPFFPTYENGVYSNCISNGGWAHAKFPGNKVIFTILAADANGNRISKSIYVNGVSYGNPYYGTSGSNGWTIEAYNLVQPYDETRCTRIVLKNTVFPVGTAKVIFSVDPNNLITELDKTNNKSTLNVIPLGSLSISTDLSTPASTNYLMGATNQDVASFRFFAGSAEPINISQLVVSSQFSSGATGTLTNLRLIDVGTGQQVGSTVAGFSDFVNGVNRAKGTFAHATFTNLNLQVPTSGSKILILRADFTPYDSRQLSTTGQTFIPVILKALDSNGTSALTASGALTGVIIKPNVGWNSFVRSYSDPGSYAGTGTLYRAKLTVAWANDAPSGATSPGAAAPVAKFVISNLVNSGNYSATINFINFNFSSSISQPAGVNIKRALTVYKDAMSTTALATTNFAVNQKISGQTNINDANFTDVTLQSGTARTFWATLDTTDAVWNSYFTVQIPVNGITWTDGVTTGIMAMSEDLPLLPKTFTLY